MHTLSIIMTCYNSQQLCMWLINYYSFYLAIMHRILQLRRWQHCDVSCSVILNPDSPHVMVTTVWVIQPIHYQDMVALAFIIAFFNFEGILSVIIFVFVRDLEVSWWGACFLSCHLTISPIYCVAEIRVNKTILAVVKYYKEIIINAPKKLLLMEKLAYLHKLVFLHFMSQLQTSQTTNFTFLSCFVEK